MASTVYIVLVVLVVLNLNWSVKADYRNPRYAQFGGGSGSQASASAGSFAGNRGPVGYGNHGFGNQGYGNQGYRVPHQTGPRGYHGPGGMYRPGPVGPVVYGRPGAYGNNRPGFGRPGNVNQLRPADLARGGGSVNMAKSNAFSSGGGSASSNAQASSRG